MKKVLLVLALAAVLVMGAHSMALGAIHHSVSNTGAWFEYPFNASGFQFGWSNYSGTFPVLKTDTWFTITPDPSPLLYASGFTSDGHDKLGIGYLKDDFSFAEFISSSESNEIKGSYLFNNHIFGGLEFNAFKNVDTDWIYVSLGYLFELGYKSDSYIALSGNWIYGDTGSIDEGLNSYEVNAKYYGDRSKFLGQIILSDNYNDPYLAVQYNWTICDGEFTLAVRGVSDFGIEEYYFIGGTWVCSENFVIDAIYGDLTPPFINRGISEQTWFIISGMFAVNDNLYLGLEYDKLLKVDDVYFIALKARYDVGGNYALTFYYQLESDPINYPVELIIGFQKQL